MQTLAVKQSYDDKLPLPKSDLAIDVGVCPSCASRNRGLCSAICDKLEQARDGRAICGVKSTVQKIPARRTICHQKESLEYIPVICSGWASSSIVLPDG